MRLLLVIPYVPNPIRVRPYQFIHTLHRLEHTLTLGTLWSSEAERADLSPLEALCKGGILAEHLSRPRSLVNTALAALSTEPLQASYCWHPQLAQRLQAELQRAHAAGTPYDAIHVEHLRGVRYALYLLPLAQKLKIPIIWDSVDSITHLFRQAAQHAPNFVRRWIFTLEAARTERYERSLPPRFHRVLVTSKIDQNAFSSPNHEPTNLTVVPNGVDLTHFSPSKTLQRTPDTLVISGKMSYHANARMVVHFVQDVMPLIWHSRPATQLWIVGKDPTAEVQALAAHPNIKVTGTVPDIAPYLQRATVAISPTVYGAGIQNKVLEAMACATPVITTRPSIAALEHIQPERDLLVADDSPSLAQQTLRFLDNTPLCAAIGQAGRAYVEKHHHWDTIGRQLTAIYQEEQIP